MNSLRKSFFSSSRNFFFLGQSFGESLLDTFSIAMGVAVSCIFPVPSSQVLGGKR